MLTHTISYIRMQLSMIKSDILCEDGPLDLVSPIIESYPKPLYWTPILRVASQCCVPTINGEPTSARHHYLNGDTFELYRLIVPIHHV